MRYPEFREFLNRGKKDNFTEDNLEEIDSEDTPLETIEQSMKELNASLIDDVLEKLKNIDFYKFEDIVLDLLIKMGYGGSKEEAKQSTSKTKDGFFIAKLSKKIRVLESSHMTSEMVEDLINFIDVKHIPFIWYSERLLKGGYKLVLLEESLDEQIKDILKRKLLSRGIIVD